MRNKFEKRVAVFGATGLIGQHLVNLLIQDSGISHITVFVRRPLKISHYQVEEIITDFTDLEAIKDYMKVDMVFCSLGTTIGSAGSVEKFREIDQHLVIRIADLAHSLDVPRFIYVSALGAKSSSRNFYNRSKGETEERLFKTGIPEVVILNPSLLLGKRDNVRVLELIGKGLYKLFGILLIGPLRKYKAIHGKDVARAMVRLSYILYPKKYYNSLSIKQLSRENSKELL